MNNFVDPVPEILKIKTRLNLPKPNGEYHVLSLIENILSKNKIYEQKKSFMPDYPYFSYIPSAVDYISSATELLTSYTPYQAEISQGLLQILFEYQSLICELTGMDVANASLYDHSTALSEALLMAIKYTGRNKVLIPKYMRHERKQVVYSYLRAYNCQIYEYGIDSKSGFLNIEEIEENIKDAAAIYGENPTYFGIIDQNIIKISETIHKYGSLFVVGIEPISLGIIREPGSYGADIVVGEAQHLSINPCFGGPSLGIIACKDDIRLIHLLPGRIIGLTNTLDKSEEGFVLALQAREQHIKREKATSNITTNTSWLAVRAAIHIALLGKTGLKKLATRIYYNTKNFIQRIREIDGFEVVFSNSNYFRNVLLKLDKDYVDILDNLYKKGFAFGKNISKYFPEFNHCILVGINEFHDNDAINELVNEIKSIISYV